MNKPLKGSLQSKSPRQIHHTHRIHLRLDLPQPRRISLPIKHIAIIRRQSIIRIRRQRLIINPLPLRHRDQSVHTLLHHPAPIRILRRRRPGKVEIKRQRRFGVRVGRIGRFLAVGGEERLNVVADEGAGVEGCEGAVEEGFVLDGFDEGEGVACCAEGVEGSAHVGAGLVWRGLGEGGEGAG